jgi:hypothetical protein
MTLGLHVAAVGLPDPSRPRLHRPVRKRRGRTRLEALVASVCVAGGLVLAWVTLPPVPTPGHVVEAFAEAAVGQDWPAAWNLLCERQRAGVDVDTFSARAAKSATDTLPPRVVHARAEYIRRERTADGPALIVAVTVKAVDQDGSAWRQDDWFRVVLEKEGFRVCLS